MALKKIFWLCPSQRVRKFCENLSLTLIVCTNLLAMRPYFIAQYRKLGCREWFCLQIWQLTLRLDHQHRKLTQIGDCILRHISYPVVFAITATYLDLTLIVWTNLPAMKPYLIAQYKKLGCREWFCLQIWRLTFASWSPARKTYATPIGDCLLRNLIPCCGWSHKSEFEWLYKWSVIFSTHWMTIGKLVDDDFFSDFQDLKGFRDLTYIHENKQNSAPCLLLAVCIAVNSTLFESCDKMILPRWKWFCRYINGSPSKRACNGSIL